MTATFRFTCCLLLALLGLLRTGTAQSFFKHIVDPNLNGAIDVSSIDVDGDGDTDLVVAGFNANDVVWYENDGTQNFTLHTVDFSISGVSEIDAADVDSDGDIDILAAAEFADDIVWYENDGNENFTKHTINGSLNGAVSVKAVDVDGDNDMDVISGALHADCVMWYENDGSENFTGHVLGGTFLEVFHVNAADIDDDGDMDLFSVHGNGDDVIWWENDSLQNFTQHKIDDGFWDASHVEIADIDQDGDKDLVATAWSAGDVAWYENDGSENFTKHTIEFTLPGASSVQVEDMDNDNDWDILVAASNSDQVVWYQNNGIQSFTKVIIDSNFDGAYMAVASDLDQDGDIDVVGTATVHDDVAWWENCTILPTDTSIVFLCAGDSVLIGSTYYSSSGVFSDTTTNAMGCDSINATAIVVIPVPTTTAFDTICANDSVLLGGTYQSVAGTYADTLLSALGCDSIVNTTLTVWPTFQTFDTVTVCNGDSVAIQGTYRSMAGTYVDSLATAHGCDSTIETLLIVLPVFQTNDTVSICLGDSVFLANQWQHSAGTYLDTLAATNGCDSVLQTTLTVRPTFATADSVSICAGDSMWLAGAYQSSAGIYTDTLTAMNGCDSIHQTTLVVFPTQTGSDTLQICAGDSVVLAGAYQSTSGSYIDTLQTQHGCDSIVSTLLTVLPTYAATDSFAICAGDSISIQGTFESAAGIYVDSLQTTTGCDSIITSVVIQLPVFASSGTLQICAGDSVLLGGQFQSVAGTYFDTLATSNGCDSVLSTLLTVTQPVITNAATSICAGDSILLGGSFQTAAANYVDTLQASTGCDSILLTALAIIHPVTSTDSISICAGDSTWLANAWQTTAGTYTDTFATAFGCDSIVATHLSVGTDVSALVTDTACYTYTSPSGNYTWTASGTYHDTISTVHGCDSILEIDLTVNTVDLSVSIIVDGKALEAHATNATFQWYWYEAGAYTLLPGATSNGLFPNETGLYAAIITQNGCTDTTATYLVHPLSVEEYTFEAPPLIYPNPTSGILQIEVPGNEAVRSVRLFDALGREVPYTPISRGRIFALQFDGAPGFYVAEIVGQTKRQARIKVLKHQAQ